MNKSAYHDKPWMLLISIYTTQYLGLSFILAASVTIFRDMGIGLDKLAWVNIIALPLLFKIFYAPFIDTVRVTFGKRALQGQYRSWLLLCQFLMGLLLFIVGCLDIRHYLMTIIGMMLIYSIAVSIQDVAIDGLASKIFAKQDHQRVNSLQFASNLLGNVIGGGVILMVYPWLQWQGSLWLMAILTGLSCLQLLQYTEPSQALYHEAPHQHQIKHSVWDILEVIIKQVIQFIQQYKMWCGLLILYPLGFSAGFALINPLLVDMGWSFADIGFVTKIYGSIVGIVSALSASFLINTYGRIQTLIALTLIQALSMLPLLFVTHGYTSKTVVYMAITAYFLVNPALLATMATLIMDKASEQMAKATFFTFQFSLFSFMGFVYAGLAMTAAKYFGYSAVMIASIVMTFMIGMLVCLNHKTLIYK